MKIGDEVYIHGYIDEIRKDTIIIKNDGGYFGTIPSEIIGREPEPCKDDISRKAVLDTLDTADKFLDEDRTVERYKNILTDAYEVLPSVNPQEPKTEPCEDCISRRAVLDEISKSVDHSLYAYKSLMECVKTLSPIIPQEPKTGYWCINVHDKDYCYCSSCKHKFDVDHLKMSWDKYEFPPCCPNCGAKMESEVSI